GISILLAVGTPSTGSGNLYCQWELSPGSGNALCILFQHSPCLTHIKNLKTIFGKDSLNPLIANNLPKIVLYSTHHVALMKSWLVQKQMALGQTTTSKEVAVDAEIKKKEPAELHEVVEVVTTAKLITEVVTGASAIIIVAAPQLTVVVAPILTTAPSAVRKRKGVVIRYPEETATPSIIIHSKAKSIDKGKGILVEEPKPLKKQAQIQQDEAYARENVAGFKMDYFKVMTYDDVRPIFKKKFNFNVAFLDKTKEQMEEEDSRALKRISESQEDKVAKKQKLDEEVAELKRHL
nr:hypothetical protein [Tanacetum cinerariifolium]